MMIIFVTITLYVINFTLKKSWHVLLPSRERKQPTSVH
jgi:hypothetical protein